VLSQTVFIFADQKKWK